MKDSDQDSVLSNSKSMITLLTGHDVTAALGWQYSSGRLVPTAVADAFLCVFLG